MNSYKKILKLSFPIVLTFLSYHVLGITDIMMVGRLGREAIAGVGIALTVFYLYAGPAESFFDSATILMSHAFGKKNNVLLIKYFLHELVIAFLAAIVGIFLVIPMILSLHLFTTNENVINTAKIYLVYTIFSLIPYFITVVISRFFMSIQKNKNVAILSNITVLINISLNFLLIFGLCGFPAMGVKGAAIATFLARVIQCILGLFLVVKELKVREINVKISGLELLIFKTILKKGIPLSEISLIEIGSWTVFTNIISRIGVTAMASHEIAMKIKDIGYLPIWALGVVTTTLISEAVGKEEYADVTNTCKKVVRLAAGGMVIFGILLFTLPEIFMRLFTFDKEVIKSGVILLKVMALYQVSDAIFIVYRSALVGVGQSTYVRNVILAGCWFIMIPVAFILTYIFKFGVAGAWIGLVVFVTLSAFFYRRKFFRIESYKNEGIR